MKHQETTTPAEPVTEERLLELRTTLVAGRIRLAREAGLALCAEVGRLRDCVAERDAAIAELRAEVAAERLRYGQQRARNAVFMQAMASLARRDPDLQYFARRTVEKADAASEQVRPEDFVAASARSADGKGAG